MIVDNTKQILDKYNMRAKKGYGQNFLISKAILEKIVKASSLTKDDYVIEIGPGIGALTEFLCINAKHVLCYEIDKDMYDILQDTLKEYDNKDIILGDFLKQDVKKDIETYFNGAHNIKVVANLPYYITTPIIFKLLEIDNIGEFTYMVQKEMGERFVGVVNTKDYNALSVYMAYFTDTIKAFNVTRANFMPSPNVDSVVLHSKISKKDLSLKDESSFLKFVKAIFNQRRKTMLNNISSFYKIPKSEIEDRLKEINTNISIRSEALSLEEIAYVYKHLFEEA